MSKKKNFWNTQYKRPTHLTLSDEPSEDLVKFTRWLTKNYGRKFLNITAQALDLGCGNGRNLIYLAKEFSMRGIGYDTSKTAIAQAIDASKKLYDISYKTKIPLLSFALRSIADPLPLPDSSVTLALDMMTSHALLRTEREHVRAEVLRVLKPGGWLFFKSFLLEGDQHAERLLKEHPGPEEGMYIHPEIGVPEYVWPEQTLREFFSPDFAIHHLEKSHKHRHADGSAWKRRTVSVYLEKT